MSQVITPRSNLKMGIHQPSGFLSKTAWPDLVIRKNQRDPVILRSSVL